MQNSISYVEVEIIDVIRETILGCRILSSVKLHETFNLELPTLQCSRRQESEAGSRVGAKSKNIER